MILKSVGRPILPIFLGGGVSKTPPLRAAGLVGVVVKETLGTDLLIRL